MNTRSAVFVVVLVLAFLQSPLSCTKASGNAEDKMVWGEVPARSSERMAVNHTSQYYITPTTNPSGIYNPIGGGWYDAGTEATLSTQEFIDIDLGLSRYKFINWTTTDMSEISNPLSPTTTVLVDKAKTVTANYALQYSVLFAQSGVYETPHEDTIVQIDGVNYYYNTMPPPFWYDNGSSHSFYYEKSIMVVANKKAYMWANTTGLSTVQSGSIIVSSPGNITGNYKTQYHLAVASQYDSPTPVSGWFDAGSEVVASVSSPVSDNLGTRYICTGWTGTGNIPALGSGTTITFTITQGSRITWNWRTQFLLAVSTIPSGLSPQPSVAPTGETVSAGSSWQESATNVTLMAETVANITFDLWSIDGVFCEQGINPVSVTMSAPHVAVAYYINGLVGDINSDGKVDMRDVGYVARRFMFVPGDPLWDPTADMNDDGKTDMVDITFIARHFGDSLP